MRNALCILLFILLVNPISSYSANKATAPNKVRPFPCAQTYENELYTKIENQRTECMENNLTQMGINDCEGKSYDAWDKALNDAYGKLIKEMDNGSKLSLKNSQREWLKYRNSCQFLNTYYEKPQGSMLLVILSMTKLKSLEKGL